MVVIIAVGCLTAFAVRCVRSLKPEIGRRKIRALKYDIDGLLKFLRDEGYFWPVHEEAIAKLKHCLPADPTLLRSIGLRKKIEDVARHRLGQPGEVNQLIGGALVQVAGEVDNILNRRGKAA